jgi:hypothetical protein
MISTNTVLRNLGDLQDANMSCLAMFQNVALRAFVMKLDVADDIGEPGEGICIGLMRSCVRTKSDLAPFKCPAHSGIDESRNS